jgi:hypothetical protein
MIIGIMLLTGLLLGALSGIDDTHEAHYRFDVR